MQPITSLSKKIDLTKNYDAEPKSVFLMKKTKCNRLCKTSGTSQEYK